jgi:hypothetical protein
LVVMASSGPPKKDAWLAESSTDRLAGQFDRKGMAFRGTYSSIYFVRISLLEAVILRR